jgi:hypothetical protein
MAEHYTRNTESVTAWCKKCSRMTTHRVDHPPDSLPGAGRLGPCLEHFTVPPAVIPPLDLPKEPDQGTLFEDVKKEKP